MNDGIASAAAGAIIKMAYIYLETLFEKNSNLVVIKLDILVTFSFEKNCSMSNFM